MPTKTSVGIDPGQSGAIAAVMDGTVVALRDMPTSARLHGKGKQINGYELATILRAIVKHTGANKINVEAVSAMPGQGVSSMFRFGESLGVIIGVCAALNLSINWVTPQKWKKDAKLIGKDKDAARTLAIQNHPEVASKLTRKADSGRADAICIAEFG